MTILARSREDRSFHYSMPTTKRALIAPREDVVDKFGHLPGDRALSKGGGDPPKRSRRGKAGTAEASGGASVSDAVQPAQSVAAGAGEDAQVGARLAA